MTTIEMLKELLEKAKENKPKYDRAKDWQEGYVKGLQVAIDLIEYKGGE